jgi:predicted MFS family arabinose efflux permease
MGAFSAASVLGVPAGLELARLGGWRAPFFAVAALGLLVAGGALGLMPPMTGHVVRGAAPLPPLSALLARPITRLSLAATAASMLSGFVIVPNLAAHLQYDLGYPRAQLGTLYMAGGAVAFVALRVAGRWIDRAGAPIVATFGTAVFAGVLLLGFAFPPADVPVAPLFVAFMLGNSTRNVAINTLSSKVPAPAERARFLSLQSAVAHVASSAGAVLSARLLEVEPSGRLSGVRTLAFVSLAVATAVPALVAAVAARLPARGAAAVSGPAPRGPG